MDKATMLYNKFKSMFLVGEGDCVLSQVLNKSIAEQRQFEEARKGALKRAEQTKENNSGTIHFSFKSFLRIYPLLTPLMGFICTCTGFGSHHIKINQFFFFCFWKD